MKKALLFVLLISAYFANAQTISITATGAANNTLQVNQPVLGYHLPNKRTYQLGAVPTVQVPNTLKTAAFITVIYNERSERVFVEPGQSIQVTITVDGKKQTVDVNGPNTAGSKLLAQLNHPFYQSRARGYSKKDSTMAGMSALIKQDMERELHPFDSLLMFKQISQAFYNVAKRDITYYYAAVKGAIMLEDYAPTTYETKHPLYRPTMHKDIEAAWAGVYKEFPMTEFAAGAPEFYYYAKDYVMWYKIMYPLTKAGKKPEQIYTRENQYDVKYNGINASFDGKLREYLLAMYQYDELIQKDYQLQLVQLYNRFTATYPASVYTVHLTPAVNDIKAYLAKANENFKPDQHLLASNTINSFDELLTNFKGKTVFIDMWATWCGPCKAEFEFNPDLKKYLVANNVQMLYISMDKDEADKQWQEMIKYYDLGGNHVRTTDNLRNDLMKIFWDGKGYAIPRYVIVKDGKIVEKDAKRPADKQKLYDQIGKYL
ncbi:TlpA family protein disulfide reductase [Mucilaginibacter mali]|uniref:TlpA family protein disulfide reductase n=1 Tax=Mucilaginibacter mali TaxID=2740462 RepID=A0A7D4PVY5_9SPHI|nr:TlpA disulfide reductase family protein [Mucilaginibacter mali]QKJ32008.1 TlpA family protein disulfide reductase [Mucilaginibacter mali]